MLRKLYLLAALFVAWLMANPMRLRAAMLTFTLVLVLLAILVPGAVAWAGEATGGSR